MQRSCGCCRWTLQAASVRMCSSKAWRSQVSSGLLTATPGSPTSRYDIGNDGAAALLWFSTFLSFPLMLLLLTTENVLLCGDLRTSLVWWWRKEELSPVSTTRVDGPSWRVSTLLVETRARRHDPCWLVMETGHPSTWAVNSDRQLG